MPLVIPNTLVNGTAHDAAEVQENFAAIRDHVNSNVIHKDGSVAMAAQLSLVGDPVSASHAVRKQYVDDRLKGPVSYTPDLITVGGTQPNLGASAVKEGQWWQIGNNLYVVEFAIQMGGGGLNKGTGRYGITIPFPAAKLSSINPGSMQGLITYRDFSMGEDRAFLGYVTFHGDTNIAWKGTHTVGFSGNASITDATLGTTFGTDDTICGKLFFTKA